MMRQNRHRLGSRLFDTVQIHVKIVILIAFLVQIAALVQITANNTTLNRPVNNIPNPQLTSNALDILNSILSKQRLEYTSNEINHDDIVLLFQHTRKFSKQPHALFIDDQGRRLGDGGRLGLDVKTEERREFEDRVRGDMVREVFVAFTLVSDVDETVVDAHLELVGGGVVWTLFSVELFETLQS